MSSGDSRSFLKLVQDSSSAERPIKRANGELWSSESGQIHGLHSVVGYPYSSKPELADYCIRKYSEKGEIVFDPFSGRGTTALQANLLGRVAWASDLNPLSKRITIAKTNPAGLDEVVLRLNQIDFNHPVVMNGYAQNFAPFYHPDTYRELANLRAFLKESDDRVSSFIELLALSRLHGHTASYVSAYSFPQLSLSPSKQELINNKRHQIPEYRAVAPRIIKRAAQVLQEMISSEFYSVSPANRIEMGDATKLNNFTADSVDLVVTTPPFIGCSDGIRDQWLELWFAGINPQSFCHNVVSYENLECWSEFIGAALKESVRVLRANRHIAVEISERSEELTDGKSVESAFVEQAEKVSYAGKHLVVDEIIEERKVEKQIRGMDIIPDTRRQHSRKLIVCRCVSSTRIKRRVSK